MASKLTANEEQVAMALEQLLMPGEQVYDVGPARADRVPRVTALGPGVLMLTSKRLLFGSASGVAVPYEWRHIESVDRRNKLMGSQVTVTTTAGLEARYYVGKVYAGQIENYWGRRGSRA